MARTRHVRVSAEDAGLLEQSAALITRMYGDSSPYAEWIVDGFRPFSVDYLLGQVNNPSRALWVAIRNDRVIGTIILQFEQKKHVVFHKLTRDPEFKGLGSRLLAFAERIAKKEGYVKARIEAFSPAANLLNYYIRKGYDKAIEMKPLKESEYIKYKSPGAAYGFLMLEKRIA